MLPMPKTSCLAHFYFVLFYFYKTVLFLFFYIKCSYYLSPVSTVLGHGEIQRLAIYVGLAKSVN